MTRPFTGRHMLAVMVGMFGVVIAVNMLMACYAVTTFGGTVVDNSYVASQRFNHWLAEAREQRALGWQVATGIDAERHVEVATRAPGGPLTGATVTAVATHPLGRAPDRAITFEATRGGRFVSRQPLPAGRWLIRIIVRRGGHDARFDDEVPA